MSADRWTICLRCNDQHDQAIAAERARVDSLYGTVPVDDYLTARANLETSAAAKLDVTFREDWEVVDPQLSADGHVGVEFYYRGRCNVCDLDITYPVTTIASSPLRA